MQLKWLETAFDGLFHLVFMASLSEEDFFTYFRSADDPYRHTDYSGKYQLSAFFSVFIWECINLFVVAYVLNVSHIYSIYMKDMEPE